MNCMYCHGPVDIESEAYHERKVGSTVIRWHFRCSKDDLKEPVYLTPAGWSAILKKLESYSSDPYVKDVFLQRGYIDKLYD